MDLVEVCPSHTVVLPVFVSGGYLFLGDAHAAMGQGEPVSYTHLTLPTS